MLRGTFVNYISVKFSFIAFVVLFTIIAGLKGEMVASKYLIYQNKSSNFPAVIGSTEVSSLTECASLCTANLLCKSFSVDCLKLPLSKQICKQQSTEVTTVADLVDSELCYVQRKTLPVFLSATTVVPTTAVAPTTTEAPTTTVAPNTTEAPTTTVAQTTTLAPPPPTTTVVPTSTIAQSTATVIDMVYGARDMCQGGSTNQDFLVLTTEGVYVYDEVSDLTSGACDGPINFTTIFKDYPSIPTINSVSGILIFQTSNIELYAEGTVYKWQIENGNLNNVLGMNSYSAHLGTTALDSVGFFWAAHRQFTSAERHFYLGADMFFMKSSQHGTSEFAKTEIVSDQNSNDMNPWSGIPTDTIAVTGYGSDPNKNYALIDSAGNVYNYQLDHSVDNRNPTKSLTLQGQLQF